MLVPTGDRLLVRPDENIEHASDLIVIAPRDGEIVESQRQFGRRGTVIATGPGKRLKDGSRAPMSTNVGDTVYFGEFINREYEENGERFFVISEADVTGIAI